MNKHKKVNSKQNPKSPYWCDICKNSIDMNTCTDKEFNQIVKKHNQNKDKIKEKFL